MSCGDEDRHGTGDQRKPGANGAPVKLNASKVAHDRPPDRIRLSAPPARCYDAYQERSCQGLNRRFARPSSDCVQGHAGFLYGLYRLVDFPARQAKELRGLIDGRLSFFTGCTGCWAAGRVQSIEEFTHLQASL
jgi:hypothetical protein